MIGCSKKNSEHYRIKCFRTIEKETGPFQKFNGSAKVSAKPAFHGEVNLSTHLWSTLTLNHSHNKTASKKILSLFRKEAWSPLSFLLAGNLRLVKD